MADRAVRCAPTTVPKRTTSLLASNTLSSKKDFGTVARLVLGGRGAFSTYSLLPLRWSTYWMPLLARSSCNQSVGKSNWMGNPSTEPVYRLFSLIPMVRTDETPSTFAYVAADPNSSFDSTGRDPAVTAAADFCSAAEVVLCLISRRRDAAVPLSLLDRPWSWAATMLLEGGPPSVRRLLTSMPAFAGDDRRKGDAAAAVAAALAKNRLLPLSCEACSSSMGLLLWLWEKCLELACAARVVVRSGTGWKQWTVVVVATIEANARDTTKIMVLIELLLLLLLRIIIVGQLLQ
mmetsp:Transcript_9326/g.16561  ORF Transcript_9326/g.16561 Transcript_9326/m.16561 type:complete len:291 (-) Transcript_9326:17-889(-)